MNIEWDAEGYKRDFSFVHQYGEDVLGLIEGGTEQRIVDLGCGNGALTKKLAEKGFSVMGIDASEDMLKLARQQYPELTFRQGDALTFTLEEKVDVIFSNAVFHWIDGEKQEQLLQNIASQLKPGGQLVCEFGGKGCAERVHAMLESCFSERGLSYRRVFYFPTIGEYAPILEKCGLRVEYAVLFDRPTPQKTEDGLRDWIHMFVKEPFQGIGEETKEEIIQETVDKLRPVLYHDSTWIVDYVRIRIRARRQPEV